MSAAKSFGSIEMSGIIVALRTQGWECQLAADGSLWKVKPPDNNRIVIKFQALHADTSGVIRQLRDHGFKWPPPDTIKPEPVIKATPFPAKPHPHVEVEKPPPPPAPAPCEVTVIDEMQAFKELRDAKAFEREAAAEVVKKKQARDAADKEYAEAKGVHDMAAHDLEEKKQKFHAAFDAEDLS